MTGEVFRVDLRLPLSKTLDAIILISGSTHPTKGDLDILRMHLDILEKSLNRRVDWHGQYKKELPPCELHPDSERHPTRNYCLECNKGARDRANNARLEVKNPCPKHPDKSQLRGCTECRREKVAAMGPCELHPEVKRHPVSGLCWQCNQERIERGESSNQAKQRTQDGAARRNDFITRTM